MDSRGVCAITGSSGYVGSCIKQALARQGWDILEMTRQPKPGTRSAEFRLGSEVAPGALEGVDALVHCAYDFKPLDRTAIDAINVVGTRKLLAAARAAGVSRVVCISTISAYPGCKSLYGKAKLEIEGIAEAHGALTLRPGLVHGSNAGGMFGKLATQLQQSKVVPLIGDGSQIQYLVHHEDLSAFIERYVSARTENLPAVLTAAHEEPWPFRKLLNELARAMGRKPLFVPVPWRMVWAGLKAAESCHLALNFRSDSVLSLMHQNPNPDFSRNAEAGLACRPFRPAALNETV